MISAMFTLMIASLMRPSLVTDGEEADAKVLRVRHDVEGEARDPRDGLAEAVAVVDAVLTDGAVDGGVETLR